MVFASDFISEVFSSFVLFIPHPLNANNKDIDASRYFIMKPFMTILLVFYTLFKNLMPI